MTAVAEAPIASLPTVTGLPGGLPTVTGLPGGLPAVIEDLDAPHQIILQVSGNDIGLSCTCLGRMRYRTLIDKRTTLPAAIAVALWRAWHRRNGVAV